MGGTWTASCWSSTAGEARSSGSGITVACDVTNPLYGPDGAAAVFGPQKGATPEQVRQLDDGLRRLAARLGKTAER